MPCKILFDFHFTQLNFSGKAGVEKCSLGYTGTCAWSVPADGCRSLSRNLAPFTYVKIRILTKNAVFWLILHAVPWSALKYHQGEVWPRQGEVTTTKEQRQGRKEQARRDFSERRRSVGWSLHASHALFVAVLKET